jgi:hypothetical protein
MYRCVDAGKQYWGRKEKKSVNLPVRYYWGVIRFTPGNFSWMIRFKVHCCVIPQYSFPGDSVPPTLLKNKKPHN